jgi:hypothetical protein
VQINLHSSISNPAGVNGRIPAISIVFFLSSPHLPALTSCETANFIVENINAIIADENSLPKETNQKESFAFVT